MQNTNGHGSRRAILYARVSADRTAPRPFDTRTGLPLPARAGVRRVRLHAEGNSKTREVAAWEANSLAEFSSGWLSINGEGAASHQALVFGAWQEEGIGAVGTLTRTATGRTTPPLAPTSEDHDATRLLRSKPPTRWGSTRSSGHWERSS
jgi:hypothetical protein